MSEGGYLSQNLLLISLSLWCAGNNTVAEGRPTSFRREPTMNADCDRLWNAQRNVSPLAAAVSLANGYNARLLLEKTADRFAA
jgi:hypothetical protein